MIHKKKQSSVIDQILGLFWYDCGASDFVLIWISDKNTLYVLRRAKIEGVL